MIQWRIIKHNIIWLFFIGIGVIILYKEGRMVKTIPPFLKEAHLFPIYQGELPFIIVCYYSSGIRVFDFQVVKRLAI